MRLGMFLCAVMCSHDGAYLFLMSCVMCCPMYYVLQHHFILISNKIELELELELELYTSLPPSAASSVIQEVNERY